MFIRHIALENVFGFHKFTVELPELGVLVGPNNAGKSSLLRALYLLGSAIQNLPQGTPLDRLHYLGIDAASVVYRGAGNEVSRLEISLPRPEVGASGSISLCFAVQGSAISLSTIDGRPVRQVDIEVMERARGAVKGLAIEYVSGYSVSGKGEATHDYPSTMGQIERGNREGAWRNWLKWLTEGEAPEKFLRVAEVVRECFPNVRIQPPARARSGQNAIELFFRDNVGQHDIADAGGGFRTLLTTVATLVYSKATIILLDEPDTHLHPDLQRRLARFIAGEANGRQILVATHAPDLVEEMPVASVRLIDRHTRRGLPVDALGKALLAIGAVRTIDAPNAASDRILFVEGKADTAVFYNILERVWQKAELSCTRLARLAEMASEASVAEFLRIDRALGGPSRRAVILKDSDSNFEDCPGAPRQSGPLVVVYLPCHELENLFVLQPNSILKAVRAVIDRRSAYVEVPTAPDLEEIEQLIDECSADAAHLDDLRLHWLAKLPVNQKQDAGQLRQREEWLKERWKSADWRRRWGPGKEIMTAVRQQIQRKYKVSFGLELLVASYEPCQEVRQILETARTHLFESE